MTKISASMMCADLLHLADSLAELEEGGADYLHCDVMDGHFVPNMMLFPDLINAFSDASRIPLDVHLMCDDPASVIASLKLRAGDMVSVHAEATHHLQRVLALIRDTGATAAVAINPATPLCVLDYVLDDIGMVLIMTVNPGYAGQKLVPQTIGKIAEARKYLDERGYSHIEIETDGNCNYENSKLMVDAGASILVSGSSGVFVKESTPKREIARFKALGM